MTAISEANKLNLWKKSGLHIAIDQHRIYGLDILRAFAISIVVITHSIVYLPGVITTIINYTYLDGVSIFFVLSGFLIGRILIKTMHSKRPDFKILTNFWWRRWLRTLPIYFLLLSVILLIYNIPNSQATPSYKRYYFFSENIFTPMPGFYIEAWSLSVEEWFYLLVPFLTFFFIRFFKIPLYKTILILSVLVILFSTSVRLERYFANVPINDDKFEFFFRMQVITRLDSLMYGVIGALISFFDPAQWVRRKKQTLIIGISILIINKILTIVHQNDALVFYNTVFWFSFNAIGTLLMLPYLSSYKTGEGVLFKIITYVSLISYSMYLTNLTPISYFLIPFLNNHLIVGLAGLKASKYIDLFLFYFLTIIGSIYLYKFVETPFMKFRDRKYAHAHKVTAN